MFTSVCAAVSVGGHTLSSGHGVPLGGLVAGIALVYACAWAATGRERGLRAITGWMAWSQLALHVVLSTAQATGVHHGAHTADPAAVATASGGADMLLSHLAAGAVCAWWLRQGEAALFSYVRLTAAALLPVLVFTVTGPVPARAPSVPLPERGAPKPAVPYLRHSLVLRGPPVPRLAA